MEREPSARRQGVLLPPRHARDALVPPGRPASGARGGSAAQSAIAAAAAAGSSSPAPHPPPPPPHPRAHRLGPNAGTSAQPRVPRQESNAPPRVYADREEAKAAFKELLEDFEIRAGAKWDGPRADRRDERFGALKTIGDKKQCFNEYQTQRLNTSAGEGRRIRRRGKFPAMLDERWRIQRQDPSTARLSLGYRTTPTPPDPKIRGRAVKDPRDREDLFRSFCDALRVDSGTREKKRDEQIAAPKRLRSMGVDSVVDWTWRRVRDELKDLENLRTSAGSSNDDPGAPIDQLEAYEEYADGSKRRRGWRRRRRGASARGAQAPRRVRVVAQAPARTRRAQAADAVANG